MKGSNKLSFTLHKVVSSDLLQSAGPIRWQEKRRREGNFAGHLISDLSLLLETAEYIKYHIRLAFRHLRWQSGRGPDISVVTYMVT